MNLEARFNPEDIQRLTRGLELAVRSEAVRTLEFLSMQAIRQLGTFDRELGHDMLAELWDHTPPIDTGDSVSMEVFSHAEDMVFYDKTSAAGVGRVRSSKYPIEGYRLLAILEGGAKPHAIDPQSGGTLTIPLPGTESRARDAVQQYGPGSVASPIEGDTAFVDHVDHPGVQANNNIRVTRTMIELGLETVAEAAARNITLSLLT